MDSAHGIRRYPPRHARHVDRGRIPRFVAAIGPAAPHIRADHFRCWQILFQNSSMRKSKSAHWLGGEASAAELLVGTPVRPKGSLERVALWLFFRQPLTTMQVLCIGLVVVGVIGLSPINQSGLVRGTRAARLRGPPSSAGPLGHLRLDR